LEFGLMDQQDGRRISRRVFLSAGAGAVVSGGAALVLGCGGGGPRQAPKFSGAPGPRRGGEVVFGRTPGELGLDPHVDQANLDIAELIYSRLYTWDAVNQIAIFNDFATDLEMPDPTGLEFVFHLRRGVKIHSHPDNPAGGEELTSEDCKQSFIRRSTALSAADKRLPIAIAGTGLLDSTLLAPRC